MSAIRKPFKHEDGRLGYVITFGPDVQKRYLQAGPDAAFWRGEGKPRCKKCGRRRRGPNHDSACIARGES